MKPITKTLVLLLLQLPIIKLCEAQGTYSETYITAHDYYLQKRYVESALKYRETIEKFPQFLRGWERYNEACSWSLAHNTDSAFIALDLCINKDKFDNYEHLVQDTDFNYIHADKRWLPLKERCKALMTAIVNVPLKNELETILVEDQEYRKLIDTTRKVYGNKSAQMEELLIKMIKQDSVNLVKVTHVLDTGGWPPYKSIGSKGMMSLFLVIQHANLQVQEKYLPMMREAVRKMNLDPSSLALLEDRIAIREGKKQIYGSQISYNEQTKTYTVSPIEDEVNVDKRRAAVGLEPLADYLKYYNIKYVVPVTNK